MLPDILDLPHVHVDTVLLIIFYGILYDGSCLDPTATSRNMEWAQNLYAYNMSMVSSWQREATASTMDFVAAIIMVSSSRVSETSCFNEL